MSESLSARVRRLVSGRITDVVDTIESRNADVVMREALREIDRAMDEVRAQIGHVDAALRQTIRQRDFVRSKLQELDGQIKFAIDQDREDLATAAISRQVDFESQLPVLEQAIGDHNERRIELDSFLSALAGRRNEMHLELKAFAEMAAAAVDTSGTSHRRASDADPTAKVEARVSRAERAFGRAAHGPFGLGGVGGDATDTTKLAELDAMKRKQEVEARLARVKAERVNG
ncbi:MAG: PspA/IM30 family protein [Pseudomonadota bacterium]